MTNPKAQELAEQFLAVAVEAVALLRQIIVDDTPCSPQRLAAVQFVVSRGYWYQFPLDDEDGENS